MPTIASVLPSFAILVVSLSFHEAAHAWTADRLGDPTARRLGRLTLNPLAHIDLIGTVVFPLAAMFTGLPLIGWARPVPVDTRNLQSPRRDFAVVAVAGPISNLLLAVGAAAALMVVPRGDVNATGVAPEAASLLTLAVVLNVLLAVFNLIPVPPLDGGNVLAGIVPGPAARLIDRLRPYGFLLLYVLMLSGLLAEITQPIRTALLSWLL